MRRVCHVHFLLVLLLIISCTDVSHENEIEKNSTLFTQVESSESGIDFKNDVADLKNFNYLLFQYMYNGGGVAAGDINNDGLVDLYFTSNQKSNKLYLNQGNFRFKDITDEAGVSDIAGWTTGVSMIDINCDGFLDIYLCKSASKSDESRRRNKLYINQKNNHFKEEAGTWNLDDPGFSVQSYFLDYDKDGDLDLYLVNHRIDFENNMKTDHSIENNFSNLTSDQLYRNENDYFVNVTKEAGIYNHAWGLSASIGDFNNDGWEDIYVCNDFVQGDYLYINQKNGTFQNEINDRMDHISFYSMGSDYEDLNNDLYPDLVVLDMVSEDHERNIRNMAAMDVEKFRHVYDIGYHRQYMFNMLHLNNTNGTFSEIAQAAGISKSDWSWSPLIADLNNDGLKDLFVTNGIKKDVTDIDYKDLVTRRGMKGNPMSFEEVFNKWPSAIIRNYAYQNLGELKFSNIGELWGFDEAINSNGCAYADLDNDGDLDLVLNNMDEVASIYKNEGTNNFIKIQLKGSASNPLAIGAQVFIKHNGKTQVKNHYLSRGYISSVEPGSLFGLNKSQMIDTVTVIWPDGKVSEMNHVKANQSIMLNYNDAQEMDHVRKTKDVIFQEGDFSIDFSHIQNEFDDFEKEILLPHKQSTFGARMAKGDVNGDGLEDLFFGNDKGNSPSLFIQTKSGDFIPVSQSYWDTQSLYEDMEAVFFDAEGDGDLDLYVVSGGNEFSVQDNKLQDRLYLNDGKGNFQIAIDKLPSKLISGCSISVSDIDSDGDLDIFVGGKIVPGKYPVPPSSFLLENVNGKFVDVTTFKAPHLYQLGMVTDSKFSDVDGDGDEDLVVVGEWMPITICYNQGGTFAEMNEITNSNGWWYAIELADFDSDGDIDMVAGNLGLNNKFKASEKKPFHVYANDFDSNGSLDIVLTKEEDGTLLPVRGRECSSEQMPFIEEKFATFTQYGRATLAEIYGKVKLEEAIHYKSQTFATSVFENRNGSFLRSDLNMHAQFSPTFSFIIQDFNMDGHLDILGVGNMYESEAETVRYDAGRGYLLLGDGNNNFIYEPASGLDVAVDARDLLLIERDEKKYIVVSAIGSTPIIYYANF